MVKLCFMHAMLNLGIFVLGLVIIVVPQLTFAYCFGHNSQYKTRIESRLGALERRLQDAQMLFYVKDQIRKS
jgi:hypothetical protein